MYARLVLSLCVLVSIRGTVSLAPECMTHARITELLGTSPTSMFQLKPYITKANYLAMEVCIQSSFQTVRLVGVENVYSDSIGTFIATAKGTRIITCEYPADSVTEGNKKVKGPLTCYTWIDDLAKVATSFFPVIFVFEAYSNGVLQGEGSSTISTRTDWGGMSTLCTAPCGGCGIQRRYNVGSSDTTRTCGIRQCVRGSDPATFRYRWLKKGGRMVRVAREMQCCYNFKGGQAVERTNSKPCRFRKINGWVATNQSPITRSPTPWVIPAEYPKYIHPVGYSKVLPLKP